MKLRCGFSGTAKGDVTSFSPCHSPSSCTLPAHPHASSDNGFACLQPHVVLLCVQQGGKRGLDPAGEAPGLSSPVWIR